MSNDVRYLAEIKQLNYLLAQSRDETSAAIQRAEDIQRDKDAEISSLCDKLSDAKLRVTQLENTNSKRMFDSVMEKLRVTQLENTNSKRMFDSVMEKLNNVTSKLIDAESELRELRAKVSDMQKFIDTLPDGLRGAWSLYLMMKQDKESEDE